MSRLIRRIFDRATEKFTPPRSRASRPARTAAGLKTRLLLQPLEERAVPTVYTVNSLADTNTGSGTAGTLRYVITQADADVGAPHTIDLTGVSGTITLTSALPTITQDMTFQGPGAASLTISGNNAYRIFNQSTPNLEIDGLTLSAGHVSGSGGAIAQSTTGNENLTINNSVITGCSASSYGGAIYNYYGGTITITGSTLQNNTSTRGGAIVLADTSTTPQPTLYVTNSQLINNRSTGNGGAIDFYYPGVLSIDHSTVAGNSGGGTGGGIYFYGNSAGVTINASTIANNTGTTGGGIYMDFSTAPLNITSSTITGNSGTNGGGIAVTGAASIVTLDNSIVTGNNGPASSPDISSTYTVQASYSAIGTAVGYTLTDNGGNLSTADSAPAALKLGALTAKTGPNGTFFVIPTGLGTGINVGDPSLAGTTDELGNTRPQDTSAGNPGNQPDIGSYERVPGPDAAVATHNVSTAVEPATYTFTVTYADNTAINLTTLGSGNVSVATPAGVLPVTVSYVSVDSSNPNSVIATYQFTAPGGSWGGEDNGVYTVNMNANQVSDANGSVSAGPLGTFKVAVPRTLTVNTTADTGTGSNGVGDLRYAITQANVDGAVGAADTIDMTGVTGTISLGSALPQILDPVTINGPGAASLTVSQTGGSFRIFNTAPGAGNTVAMSGFTISGGTSGTGAGVNVSSGNLTLNNMTISGNSTSSSGGAVYNASTGAITITNSILQNNTASGGAGVYNSSTGVLTVTNSQILNNSSTGTGGGIYNGSSAPLTLTGDVVRGNSTSSSGGGVYMGSGLLTVTGTTIANNTAGGTASLGGGIDYASTAGAGMSISNSSITGNIAKSITGGGGGVYFAGTVGASGVSITNTTIANNVAVNGAGIELASLNGTVTLTSDTIAGNTATNANVMPGLGGGGIGLRSVTSTTSAVANVSLDNTIVSGNLAVNGYNDITAVPAASPLMTTAVSAVYSAIGSTAGFKLSDLGGNVIGGNLLLGPVGSDGSMALLAGSPAINAGDPGLNGTTDQLGTSRPQGLGVDMGAVERVANTLSASATVSNIVTTAAAGNPTYQFTVTYADNVNINTGSIGASDVTIGVPAGVTAPTVSVFNVNSTNPQKVVVTYQFTAPGGSWALADAGAYTVNMGANQVTDANGSVPAGTLASFVVAPPQTFVVTDTLDDTNPGSLRYAITQANALAAANPFSPVPEVITFDPSVFSTAQTITLGSSLPTVAGNLTITGPGSNLLTITRTTGTFNFLPINDTAGSIAVNLSGLTMSGAVSSVAGAGINDTNAAALTLTDVTIKNNSTSGTSSYGGAINLASANTAVTLINSTLQNNTSASTGNGGGAINFLSNGSLTMTNSVITGNRVQGFGGAVNFTSGTNSFLTVTNSTVSNNSAGGGGGGLRPSGGTSVLIDRSTISGNTAVGNGGGIYFSGTAGGDGVKIVNSTIANNSAGGSGGAIALGGSPAILGLFNIVSSTITGNSAGSTSTTYGTGGGGIALMNAATSAGAYVTIALDNSIVSGNSATAANGRPDISTTQTGVVTVSAYYSAIGSTNGFFVTDFGGNLYGASLNLGSLSSNGGPTQTVPLNAGSPAVNAGDPAQGGPGFTDQRGTARPQGPGVDMGAFERVPGIPSASAPAGGYANVTTAGSTVYQFTVTYTDDTAIKYSTVNGNNNAVTVTPPSGVSPVAVTFVSATPTSNAAAITATYQFTFPPVLANGDDNGTWTVNVAANQVQNTNNNYVQPGAIGSFQVSLPRTYTVTNTADSGPGSLRAAVTSVNADLQPDVITFAAGLSGTITLTSGVLTLTNSVTITGPVGNGIIISGNNSSQVFNLSATGKTFAFNNLEITGGNATSSGGAVYVGNNIVTFDTDWVHGNKTTSTGGGIGSAVGATVTVTNSAITGNSSGSSGGGFYGTGFSGTTTLLFQNSTISGNSANGVGGGIGLVSFYTPGSLAVHNCTITANTSTGGGGIRATPGSSTSITIDLQSSIVSGNFGPAGSPDFLVQAVNASHSAIGSTAGITTYNDDGTNLAVGTALNLQPLASNGGPTPTQALLLGSPAIDAGSNPDLLATDQRGAGYPREAPVGSPDIGAFERQPGIPSATGTATDVTATNPPVTYQFTVAYSDDTAMNYSTINGNNNAITVTPPTGVGPVTVTFVSATPTSNAATITATYQFTFPAGLSTGADNGLWTINMVGNQVYNTGGHAVPGGQLTTFHVSVPRTITVTNTNDSGAGSLRDAMTLAAADAPTSDVIQFSNSTAGGAVNFYDGTQHTIMVSSAVLPTIVGPLTITGPEANQLTINGGGVGRIFTDSGPSFSISGVTLTGGVVAGAGGVVDLTAANENLTITNSVITGNSATGRGAVVYHLSGGTVTITGTTVSGNSSSGGVLWMNESSTGGGALVLTNSSVVNNLSSGNGGAIGFYYGGPLTITGSSITGNSTSGIGGAAYVWGSPTSSTTITNSTIANNTGSTGGAFNMDSGASSLTATSTTFYGNVATGGNGGAIYNSGTGAITLDNSILSGNSATTGAAIYTSSTTATVGAAYSAIDDTTGFTLTDNGGNLSIANSTVAALALQPLANQTGPNGTFGVIGLGAGSTALDVGDPALAGTTDQLGTTRPVGAGVDIGAVEKVNAAPPHIGSVVVGSGAQRSEVRSITVTFDGPVTFVGGNGNAAAAFQLLHTIYDTTTYNAQVNNLQTAVSTNGSGQTVVTLTFTTTGNAASEVDPQSVQSTAGGPTTPSLGDGRFTLTVLASNVSGPGGALAGNGTTAGTNYVSSSTSGPNGYGDIYRVFGDINGDGLDDLTDLTAFRNTYNSSTASGPYVNALDADNDGVIDLDDLTAFRNHYNHHV
jgi:hypothetical protein